MDIHIGTDGVVLTFKAEDGAVANSAPAGPGPAAMAGHRGGQYGAGGWPRDVWPSWMGGNRRLDGQTLDHRASRTQPVARRNRTGLPFPRGEHCLAAPEVV
ncbi:hypothetical protein ACRAWD_28220 [Caulobacter segnis]